MITVKIRMLKLLAIIGTLSLASITFMVLIFLPVCFSLLPTPKPEHGAAGGGGGRFPEQSAAMDIVATPPTKKVPGHLWRCWHVLVVIGLIGTSKMQIGGQAPGAGAFYMDAPYAVGDGKYRQEIPRSHILLAHHKRLCRE